MLRVFLVACLLTATVYGTEPEVFKNCTDIAFCAELRNKDVDASSQFSAKVSGISIVGSTTNIALTNGKNESLVLQLFLLEGSKLRIKIAEPDSTRYELSDVLESEPKALSLNSMNHTTNTLTFGVENEGVKYSLAITEGPPFTVEFYRENQLEVVFNGEHLIMTYTNTTQYFGFGVGFEGASKLYGLFHHATRLALTDTTAESVEPFRLRNSDSANYKPYAPKALYGAIPVIYGHSAEVTSGIFLHNAAEQWIDISYSGDRPSAYFMVEGGSLDLFVLLGPTPKEVVRQYTSLTGVAHLPQLWALGYHQCRFTYWTQEEVKEVVAKMDENDFPIDVVWLDDGHSDKNRYFRWNPENFSDPLELQRNISSTGRKMVAISDPHIKIDMNYSVYAGAKDLYFVKWTNGSNFEGNCWPGLSSWIDYLNPIARDYYGGWYAYDKFNDTTETIAGFWNDMNEPSVFDDALEGTFPFELVHDGPVLHRDVHNIYGFLQTKATHAGLLERDKGLKRPFILTRSHFAGSQRYAAMWTGDNTADWPYIGISYSECMTANLLGMVFCGADVGGFFGNPSVELAKRWFQAATWLPFFRGHSNKGTERREPYVYDSDTQTAIRTSLKIRYKHIPVWYTLFYEHTRYGDPVIRPLLYDYPELLEYDDHLLLGTDIMVRPVLEADATEVTVTFPGEETNYWYRVDGDSWEVYTGGSEKKLTADLPAWAAAPFFYRGGSIIARKDREKSSTSKMLNDPYTLYVNLDSNSTATGRLYIDDYTSFEYSKSNSYFYLKMDYNSASHGVYFSEIDGNSEGINMSIQSIIVHEKTESGTKSIRKEYTTAADGTPLNSINIVKQLNRKIGGLTLYL